MSKKTIITIGDSIVCGRIGFHTDPNFITNFPEHFPNGKENDESHSWQYYLIKRLNSNGFYEKKYHTVNTGKTFTYLEGNEWIIYNHGTPGARTYQIAERFDTEVLELKPDYVIIAGTVNDPRNNMSLSEVSQKVDEMVRKAKANNIIPILSVYTPHTDGIYYETDRAFLNWYRTYAKENHVMLIDWYEILEDENKNGALSQEFIEFDLLHPNRQAYEKMGNFIPLNFFYTAWVDVEIFTKNKEWQKFKTLFIKDKEKWNSVEGVKVKQ